MEHPEEKKNNSIDSIAGYTGRILGIDYGTKRIGVAVSDESNTMAFPVEVFKNEGNKKSAEYIYKVCSITYGGIEHVVLGESKDYKGVDNVIMEDVREFAEHLKSLLIETHFEPEVLSTMQAERIQGKRDDIDSSAAAVILQSFLDRMHTDTSQKTMQEIRDSKYEL